MLHISLITKLEGNAAVGIVNAAAADDDIAEVLDAFGSDFDGCACRSKRAAGDDDVLAGAVLCIGFCGFQNNAVIGCLNVAVRDPDMLTVIRINAVTVCHHAIVQNADTVDLNLTAADEVCGPEAALPNGNSDNGKMRAVLHENQRDARIKGTVNLILAAFTVIDFLRAVNDAAAGNADAIGIL